jgi:hypothetical protein
VKGPLRLLLLLGLAAGGLWAFRETPREVTLVYAVEDPATVRRVDVDVRSGDAALRRAELRFPEGAPDRIRHEVRLRDGSYRLDVRVVRADGSARAQVLPLEVAESGPVVLAVTAGSAAAH